MVLKVHINAIPRSGGQLDGYNGSIGVACWHWLHFCISWSMSLSLLNHQTYILANVLILEDTMKNQNVPHEVLLVRAVVLA